VARIKIGNIGTQNTPEYGIRITNKNNIAVMETDDIGELWLKDRLRVGTAKTSTVEIGYLSNTRSDGKHEVIHAGNTGDDFIVYEDGKVIAKNIEVRGGRIGNMTIAELEGGDRYDV
jgi:hypothetical protein